MSLLDVVRSAVAIADSVVKPLEPTVQFERCTSSGTGGYGARVFAEGLVPLRAIVEWKQRQVPMADGKLAVSTTSVLFLDVTAIMAATKNLGVTVKDRVTIPNGEVRNVLSTGGFIDAGTGVPVATEAYL